MITVLNPSSIAGVPSGHRRSAKAVPALVVVAVVATTALGAYKVRNALRMSTIDDPGPAGTGSLGIGARTLIIASRILPPSLLLRLGGLIAKFSRPQANTHAVTDNTPAANGNTPAVTEAEHHG